jgi:hypothetical protein
MRTKCIYHISVISHVDNMGVFWSHLIDNLVEYIFIFLDVIVVHVGTNGTKCIRWA